MKVLFDTRHYVLDREIGWLADSVSVYILERVGLNDAGGVRNAKSVAVEHIGSDFERRLVTWGIELTLPTFIRRYHRIVFEINPDVIVAADFFRLSSWQAVFYKWRHPETRLIILSETKRWPTRMVSRVMMWIFLVLLRPFGHLIDKVIVYTDDGRRFFTENWPDVSVVVVPPSVDTDFFAPTDNKTFMPGGVLRILMNARFVDYKRHVVLLLALKKLKDQGELFTLTLIGRDETGREAVRKQVLESGLENQTCFLDSVPKERLPALYTEHDLLVLPSYNEALGMVVPEAMASGLPTLTSDTVGANVYVVPGATGFIFKTDDVDDLKRMLTRCFDINQLSAFSTVAREYIVSHHAATVHSDRLMKELL